MDLQPYPTWTRRAEKVIKHYFNHRERWWEIDGRGLIAWTQDWNLIPTRSMPVVFTRIPALLV